jgi:hypothetical protein
LSQDIQSAQKVILIIFDNCVFVIIATIVKV